VVKQQLALEQDRLGLEGDRFVVVHGCAAGADKAADEFVLEARSELVVHERYPADWVKHGKAAGMIRNREMARAGADLCLAFWDGLSKGTAGMISEAVRAGIPVRIIPAVKP